MHSGDSGTCSSSTSSERAPTLSPSHSTSLLDSSSALSHVLTFKWDFTFAHVFTPPKIGSGVITGLHLFTKHTHYPT